MKMKAVILFLLALSVTRGAAAQEGAVPKGVLHLDHVFVILMENHGYNQIFKNPSAPFINKLAKSANLGTNYFAVGHPSLTNYLEIVGGSNFGVRSDDYPNWHSAIPCQPNIASGLVALDNPAQVPPVICPISGSGKDAVTPALDCTNEVQIPVAQQLMGCYWDLETMTSKDIPSAPTIGKSIAQQLVEHGMNWKSYQEGLPPGGADGVNISDGFFTNKTDFTPFISDGSFSTWTVQGVNIPAITTQAQGQGDIVYLYAVKHNPFVYFQDIQEGLNPRSSLRNVVGFEGPKGLYADLASGHVPNLAFIAPNQCNDQHARGNAGPFCNFDAVDNGTQSGLNEANILMGDVTVERIVSSIKQSPTWRDGNNAIVIVWDENDYTATPNQVMLIVDTNHGEDGVQSGKFYNHFSLLKSLEAGFELPCLNHACDASTNVMSDLFDVRGRDRDRDRDDDDDDDR